MNKSFGIGFLQFCLAFALFSVPALFAGPKAKKMKANIEFPKVSGRKIANVPSQSSLDQCKIKRGWRYQCDDDRKNCYKDKKIAYKECQKKL
jgi:hypothetical protein